MIKRGIIWLVLLVFLSCNDGEVDIPSLEFQEEVGVCKDYVLYRSNAAHNEAFVLYIPSQYFTDTTANYPINADNCTYRIFDDTFGSDYFCAEIPPSSPLVIKEWKAVASAESQMEIVPENTGTDEEPVYSYTVTLHHLLLENGDEQMIYDTYVFGSFLLPAAQ